MCDWLNSRKEHVSIWPQQFHHLIFQRVQSCLLPVMIAQQLVRHKLFLQDGSIEELAFCGSEGPMGLRRVWSFVGCNVVVTCLCLDPAPVHSGGLRYLWVEFARVSQL
jgi:hypothetical protein